MNEAVTTDRSAIIAKLTQTQPWLRFVGIMMMIVAVLMILGGTACTLLGAFTLAGMIPSGKGAGGAMLLSIGLLYVVLSVIYFFPARLLLKNARAIRTLATAPEEATVIEALEAQRRFWKFIGVFIISILAFYLLAIAAAFIIPAIQGITAHKN
jgi:hypothetical protein